MTHRSSFAPAVDEIFRARAAADTFSGVVRITRGEHELFAGAYGFASRAWSVPVTMETRFNTASLTKLFTAVATLQLVDKEAFALDTRVIPFLGLRDTNISEDVTVFQLLTHTSGIGDDAEEEDGEDYADLWLAKPNYAVTETADFLPQFALKPANFPPGQGCRYCNCGYILLGLMIERATGISYREVVRDRILAPASMTKSGFFRLDRPAPDLAEGCDPVRDEAGTVTEWKRNIYSFPPIGSPDSGAQVTAADLDHFLRAAKAGRLLSPDLTERLFTPQVHYKDRDGWEMRYGLGMWFYVEPNGHVLCCQKEGYNAGVSAVMRYFPDWDVNLVILSNMADGVWEASWQVHDLVVGEAWGDESDG
jgi:CubicO group peptidase (beta-lactamase class C family)